MDLTHTAWPFFAPAHRALAENFCHWTATNLAAHEAEEGGDGRVAREMFCALARAGFLALTLPQADAGGVPALDLRALCLMREICGYSSAMADVALSEPWLGILPVALYGSAGLRQEALRRYAEGTLMPAFALSEPDAGSDAAAITTQARRDGDGYVIDGRKTWTSNCGLADAYVVFARTDGPGGASGISAFWVEGDDPGIVLEQRLNVLPPHTVGTWRLESCRVPAERLIGKPGDGFAIAMRVLELFRPSVGAAALGFARRAFDEARRRSLARTAFRKPLAEFQLVQAKLADMAVKIDASALLVYRAAWQHDAGDGAMRREAATAKLFSTEAACEVIDQAVQIFGGLGVTRGTTVERLYRHARAFRIFDGASEIQQMIIAREVLRQDPTGKAGDG